MRITKALAGSLAALVILSAAARAEEKTKPPLIPLRVDVVFTEYQGEKKVSSLPYTLGLNANVRDYPQLPGASPQSGIRVGVNVPVSVDKDNQVRYENVGTRIDCSAISTDDGHIRLYVNTNRSSLYFPTTDAEKKSMGYEGELHGPSTPMIRRFDANLELIMRDGQTIDNELAADPVTGHVWKIAVTLHVIK